MFDTTPVRGEWVNLQQSWQEVLRRKEYPAAVRRLLGELMAAAALLTSTVKMKGRLVLQIRADGPVKLLMVECTSEHTLRGLAQWQGDIVDDADFSSLVGAGTLAITIEVDGARQPYQGVVSLQGQSVADTLETYFAQSEQLPTRVWLAADEQAVAGLFLQQLPGAVAEKAQSEEDWSRLCYLTDTVSDEELLSLDAETLLHRLFHEEQLRVYEPVALRFACTCSRERVVDTIKMLGQQEADEILQQEGMIDVTCEFCNQRYHFDAVDVAEIFTDAVAAESNPETLH